MFSYYGVYRIVNLVNSKIYVGIHRTNDLNDNYMGSGNLIRSAIKKYGLQNFTREYLYIFDNEEDMLNMESVIVNDNFIKDPQTYNICVGGMGGNGGNNDNYKYLLEHHKSVNNQKFRSYEESPKFCEYCKSKLSYEKRTLKFCGHPCAARYSNPNRRKIKIEKIPKINPRELYELNGKICKQCMTNIPYDKRMNTFCGRTCKAVYTNTHRYTK